MGRMLTAWADAMAAAFERFTAEAREAAKSLEGRRYWQGYRDGIADAGHTCGDPCPFVPFGSAPGAKCWKPAGHVAEGDPTHRAGEMAWWTE